MSFGPSSQTSSTPFQETPIHQTNPTMAGSPPPKHLFLPIGSPHDAAVHLLYKLPGHYRLVRRTHHSDIVTGTNLPFDQLICPSHGTCHVTLRAPADPMYEMELVQTTTINLRTWSGLSATKVEERVFRIKYGRWTLWSVEQGFGDAVVGGKLADLTIGEVRAPERVGGLLMFGSGSGSGSGTDVMQRVGLTAGPWRDGRGVNAMAFGVWVGRQVTWTAMHLVDRTGGSEVVDRVGGSEVVDRVGGSEVCSDEFWPIGEGQGGGGGGGGA